MSNVYLGFDLETGDLEPCDGDLLTGYFSMLDEDFKIIDELSLQLKPEGRLPVANPRALATNGIDLQKHIEDPNTVVYAEGRKKLLAMIDRHLKKKGRYSNIIPMGYNILTFDIPWAHYHLLDKATWNSKIHYKALDVMQHVDMLKQYGWLPPSVGNLASAVEFFGVAKGQAHVARDDILMTVGVLRGIQNLMDSKKNGGSSQDLISLLEQE
jgi:hypothetical protein